MTALTTHSDEEDFSEIWYPEELEDDDDPVAPEDGNLIFVVQASSLRRNTTDISLEAAVRQYCNARMQGMGKGKPSITKVEAKQVFDILGLLRALQYDVQQYNTVAMDAQQSWNERKYACYRLIQQALALGVKLTSPWQATATTTTEGTSTPPRPILIPGLDALLTYLETTFSSALAHANENIRHGVVDFDSLMQLYQPGTDLLDRGLLSGLPTHTPLLVRCRASHYTRGKSAMGKPISNFHAALECVVATGQGRFAVVEMRYHQYEFKGTRRIADTNSGAMTGEILTQATDPLVLQELYERGTIYQQVCSSSDDDTGSGKLVQYTAGVFWPVKQSFAGHQAATASNHSNRSGRSSRTGGRLMVDTVEAWTRGIHPAKAPADGAGGEAVADAFKAVARINRQQEKQSENTTNGSATHASEEDDGMDEDILLLQSPLPDSLIRRTWPVVCGFSLETRSWGLVLADGIRPILFHEQAFDDLVLPTTRKRLLRALITSHGQDQKSASVDVLPGKGEGIIFLLHGPPGVGKTLTAEAVSEVLHRPLYRVSMGELGTTPESLESRLQEIFDLCLPWQALVLIDEAEMLLEKRSHSGTDLVRNAMVCVMLRLMEYYPGILFLTTNSGKESLDPAIASRLTCTLGYDSLSVSARREIWKTTLNRIEKSGDTVKCDLSDGDYDFLASAYADINGRQIKNAVQLATALCRYEESILTLHHLQETMEMTNVPANNKTTIPQPQSNRSVPKKTTTPPVAAKPTPPSTFTSTEPLVSGVDMATLDSMVMNRVVIPDGQGDDDEDDVDIDMDNLPTDDDHDGDDDDDNNSDSGASVTC